MDLDVDNTKQSPLTTISIGPGIRGIERGIESTGTRLNHIAYVEIEAFIVENLVAEMEQGILDPAVVWSDCKTFPSELFRGKVNLLLAGYPCQPFSNAGKRKGADDPRHLWPHIERTIDIIRPDICMFENVRGHITLGLREVIESLEGLGYKVHWGIFSAEETGASHKRERVFIMAVRKDLLENTKHTGMRGRNNEDVNWRCEVQTERSIQLDNSRGKRSTQDNEICTGRNSAELAGSELANSESVHVQGFRSRQRKEQFRGSGSPELGDTEHNGLSTFQKLRSNEETGNNRRQEEQKEAREFEGTNRSFDGESLSGCFDGGEYEELGNTNEQGLQGRFSRISGERSRERITGANGPFAPVSRPGQPQHEWECPRTTTGQWETKSGMGGAVNGYKFREDFLRALGNSVYSETAALAWETLLNEHGLKI